MLYCGVGVCSVRLCVCDVRVIVVFGVVCCFVMFSLIGSFVVVCVGLCCVSSRVL